VVHPSANHPFRSASAQTDGVGGTIAPKVVSALSGTWTGTTTSNAGSLGNGTVSLVFTAGGASLAANVTWTSARTNVQYGGTASGSLDALAISAQSQQACTYKASATLTDPTHLSGTYSAVGTGCRVDAGSFAVTKQGS
jgi:hypothetical protein